MPPKLRIRLVVAGALLLAFAGLGAAIAVGGDRSSEPAAASRDAETETTTKTDTVERTQAVTKTERSARRLDGERERVREPV